MMIYLLGIDRVAYISAAKSIGCTLKAEDLLEGNVPRLLQLLFDIVKVFSPFSLHLSL
jgi:hypothetical protein